MAETPNTHVMRLEYLMGVLAEKEAKTQEEFRETDQRFRDTDARVERLVIAIGKLLRQKPE